MNIAKPIMYSTICTSLSQQINGIYFYSAINLAENVLLSLFPSQQHPNYLRNIRNKHTHYAHARTQERIFIARIHVSQLSCRLTHSRIIHFMYDRMSYFIVESFIRGALAALQHQSTNFYVIVCCRQECADTSRRPHAYRKKAKKKTNHFPLYVERFRYTSGESRVNRVTRSNSENALFIFTEFFRRPSLLSPLLVFIGDARRI